MCLNRRRSLSERPQAQPKAARFVFFSKAGQAAGFQTCAGRIELLREQSVLWLDGLLKIVFAETETGQGDSERGIALLDEALATADGAGYRAFSVELELHRVHGVNTIRDVKSPLERLGVNLASRSPPA
jgi:hypothetical protein